MYIAAVNLFNERFLELKFLCKIKVLSCNLLNIFIQSVDSIFVFFTR